MIPSERYLIIPFFRPKSQIGQPVQPKLANSKRPQDYIIATNFVGTIIAAMNGQAMVSLKLRLSENSSSHRHLHRGSGLNYQSLACITRLTSRLSRHNRKNRSDQNGSTKNAGSIYFLILSCNNIIATTKHYRNNMTMLGSRYIPKISHYIPSILSQEST